LRKVSNYVKHEEIKCDKVQHFYGTYVLCKEGWGNFQNDYMHKKQFIVDTCVDNTLNVLLIFHTWEMNGYI
jgi:hypothetical protein